MQVGESPTDVPKPEPTLILIVDDEAAIAETLAEFMLELGYPTLIASNGEQALTLARLRWPALVFTDLMMPYLNGIEFIAALRAEAAARKVTPPFTVLLTAAGKRAIKQTDADAIVLKPFELEQIEQVVNQCFK
jgi:CheY-like chemotaxis protein